MVPVVGWDPFPGAGPAAVGVAEKRLLVVMPAAEAGQLAELTALFANVEGMTSRQIGANVVAALTWVQDKPEHRSITTQLEMVAMNLKNLKNLK